MKAINKLKSKKKDCLSDLSSNCFRKASISLVDHIAVLFSTFLFHGYVLPKIPMIPLVKDSNGNVSSSDNYRAIGLSTVLVKVLEYVFLFRSYKYLSTNTQQFGYKQHHSTIQCTWVANETISYYNSMKSDVYCCLLDCTKLLIELHLKHPLSNC